MNNGNNNAQCTFTVQKDRNIRKPRGDGVAFELSLQLAQYGLLSVGEVGLVRQWVVTRWLREQVVVSTPLHRTQTWDQHSKKRE